MIRDEKKPGFVWINVLWLAFLGGLALLPPINDIRHKQLILLTIGLFQIFEGRIFNRVSPARRNSYDILIKILLASLLVEHTGGIDSSYYLIYYLPVVSAAMQLSARGALFWTLCTSAAYLSFLVWALQFYSPTPDAATELAIRNLFFFLVAILVNQFVSENRRQSLRYQKLAETMAETNRRLEQVQAEARRSERLAALGQLSAGLAHEIRNPLGVIKGSAEMLNQKLEVGNLLARELAGYISAEVDRLNSLVGRFLDFARPLEAKLQPENIVPLLDRALASVEESPHNSKVEVLRQYASGLPSIPLDAQLCERVFSNLIQNAYEAMPHGGKIIIRASPARSGGATGLEIEVEDTGPGIPEDLREQIFNPFFTTKETGTGLGLSIVSKIVDSHQGWVRLVSRAGQGACFRIFLPAA